MRDFKTLTWDILPCWYELSWDAEHVGIILRVHQDFINTVKPIPSDARIFEGYEEVFGFTDFQTGFDKDFGFDNSFLRLGEKDGFVEFFIKIPAIKFITAETCDDCNGSGHDEFRDGKCFHCNGTGKVVRYRYQEAQKISATFSVFFMLARGTKHETSAKIPQLMTVVTSTRPGMHGGAMGGEFSIPLTKWLCSVGSAGGQVEILAVSEAMARAWDHMYELGELDRYYTRAWVADEYGWLNTQCPGNATGLAAEWNSGHDVKEGKGYRFSGHNVDTAGQQLTLLAGLAALHDLAREAIDLEI